LQETKNDGLKVVTDATDLTFLPSSFDAATSFFSLMYIKTAKHLRLFQEIHKVLKDDGRFNIWDVMIPPKHVDKPIFAIFLEILLPNEKVTTGYGVGWDNKEQDLQYFKELAGKANFSVVDEWSRNQLFYLGLAKI